MPKDQTYFCGYRHAELQRLQQQAEHMGQESERLFDEIGISEGARVLEIGCGPRGCLDLLAKRVGIAGTVVGVDINESAVALARSYLVEQGLSNVEVICGDARSTNLPGGSFDVVASRLVLVTVPRPEEIVAEAIRLARAGGYVAFHEVDWASVICDPPSQGWTALVELMVGFTEDNGNDLFIGRKLPRILRAAGLTDIRINPIVEVCPLGDPRRPFLLHFADNLRERIIEQGLTTESALDDLKETVERHLDDPHTSVFAGLFVQAWGVKPS